MSQFCGSDFWNEDITWNTDSPDFTPCFHKTVLAWSPTLILAVLGLNEIRQYKRSPNRKIPWTFLNLAKVLLTAMLVLLAVTEFIFTIVTDYDDKELTNIYPVDYITNWVYILTYIMSFALLLASKYYGIRTSPAQFFYFLSCVITGSFTLRSIFLRSEDVYDKDATEELIVFYTIQLGLSCLLFLLNCFSDAEPIKYDERIKVLNNPCPQISASYLSKLSYFWSTPLIWKGFRQPLTAKDLWDMSPDVTSRGVVPDFDLNLNPIMEKSKHKDSTPVSTMSSRRSGSGSLHLKTEEEIAKANGFSVLPAMIKTFGPSFFLGAAMKIMCDLLAMVSPQMMKLMIGFVETKASANQTFPNGTIIMGETEEDWKGYLYACIILLATMLNTVLLSQYFERMFIVGMNLRTSLISAIYRKSLRMTGAARKESTVGEIVNLMSVDVQRFMDLLPYLNMLWSAPLQIVLCTYFMYQELGPSVFAGVGLLFLSIPLNGYIAGISRKYQLAQMKNKDKRVKLMNEILGGIKVLKLYGWEPSFQEQVLGIRDEEIKVLKKAAWLTAFMSFFWTSVPFLVALLSFGTYVLVDSNNVLDAQKAFVTMSYLNIMRMPMAVLPFMIVGLVQANVSLNRVNKFMNNAELDQEAVGHDTKVKDPIMVENASFRWASDEPTVLENVNVNIKRGSLTAIVGTVGTGKSSLISAMLGEMEKRAGKVNVVGSIAYVPQQAWMQNASVKENILFGKVFNGRTYEKVIDACALRSDLKILPGGDATEIGEKGINLSGGQKQRVSLARAVYNDADLYLLDDPLSAVDSHVGKHIFDHVISDNGLLGDKTRVLVTHGITYLPKTDHIIVLKDGKVSEQGSYQELIEQKGDFANFLLEYMNEMNDDEADLGDIKSQLEDSFGKAQIQRRLSRSESQSPDKKLERSMSDETDKKNDDTKKLGATLIEKESVETGSVSAQVYLYYMKYLGLLGVITGICATITYQGSSVATNYWLNIWTDNSLNSTCWPFQDSYTGCRNFYLGIYGSIGVFQSLSVMILTITVSITTLNGSRLMHKSLLSRVLKGPMAFFDTTPLGRIVNRFAKDVDVCDNTLPANLRQWLSTFANFVGTIILIITVIPWFGLVVIPIGIIFMIVQKIYVSTSRQLKRLESVSRSPIYSHFGETLNGASTIRAFGLQNKFILESEAKVDQNQVCYFPSIIANRWLAVRLETIGNLITFTAALIAILSIGSINPSEVGLIISYALNVTQVLNWLVRMTSDVETNIVAVERIKEYTEIDNEADWTSKTDLPSDWPSKGSLTFANYGMRYREGLDLVLKNIQASVGGGEKIGIVGRTGAGKSSLTVALFRLVEPAQGTIEIDQVDIRQLGLHELRTKLTIIPQDPVLFSGTLRINLDPFNAHSDDEIWNALELAHLKDYASTLQAGLGHEVAEGGENLSVGQRQLICLARALLRKTKILILDEATAAVDLETDDLIQATIRKEFRECTVLTIAHRLNTIMDYDRIMVLDKGQIAELEAPNKLLEDTNSIFYSMAKDAGLA